MRKSPEQEHHQSVPDWEKKFCTSICKMSWKKIRDTQKLPYLNPKISEWDDSGAKEAFDKGKARYWAKINDLPCDIPWPSPDEYIDDIDHDAIVNPELIEDLYKVPEPINDKDDGCINIKPTGWGDLDEDKYNNQAMYTDANDPYVYIKPTGWGDEVIKNECSNDDYGGFKVNPDRDYIYSKKEVGSNRCKDMKKAFYGINPRVNWKAQRESSWQWQKKVS